MNKKTAGMQASYRDYFRATIGTNRYGQTRNAMEKTNIIVSLLVAAGNKHRLGKPSLNRCLALFSIGL